MIEFASSRQLELWLVEQGIDLDLWGQDTAKSVADLWLEILNGETTLHESPPRRQVSVVELLITRGDMILIEAMQELASGERRYRNHLPAEKMKPGETVLFAAQRCLHEEFALDEAQLQKVMLTHDGTVEKQRTSPSYPGLTTVYQLHRVRVDGVNFPEQDFSTINQAHTQGDPVKAHYWKWTDEITVR